MNRLKLLLLIFPLLLASCVDEDSMLGLGLVPDSDKVNLDIFKVEKTNLKAFIFHEGDSLKTSNYRYMTLGSYSDNEFGKVSTSIYTQISLSSNSQDFSSSTYDNSDSIVLTIAYTGAFTKDTSIKSMDMDISVYEITESFKDSTTYYTNSNLQYNPTPIYSGTINVSPKKSVVLGSDTVSPHLRINLGSNFLAKIKTLGNLSTNDIFKTGLKGFYIKATPSARRKVTSNGLVAYLDMYSSLSGMSLYYRDASNKTQKYNFVFDDKSYRFTHVDYDFSGTALSTFGLSSRKSKNDSINCQAALLDNKMLIGTFGAAYAKISIDSLLEWYKDSTQSLGGFNQALLTIPVNELYLSEGNSEFNFPTTLVCYRKDTDGKFVYIHDAFDADFYNGKYDKTSKSYKMRITSHLQNYLNGNIKSSDIYIFPDARTSSASRVVLNGPQHPTNPAKIEIIYTR